MKFKYALVLASTVLSLSQAHAYMICGQDVRITKSVESLTNEEKNFLNVFLKAPRNPRTLCQQDNFNFTVIWNPNVGENVAYGQKIKN